MLSESSLRRYLHTLKSHWQQLLVGLVDDIRYSKLSHAEKDAERKMGRPPEGHTNALVCEHADAITLFEESIAEMERLGPRLHDLAMPRLMALRERHRKLLDVAWTAWEQEVYYHATDHGFRAALDNDEKAGEDLQALLLAVDECLRTQGGEVTPPLNDTQQAVLDLLRDLPPGKGMTGKQIINALREHEIDQSTLTSRIIPFLRQHYHVANKRVAGYYLNLQNE